MKTKDKRISIFALITLIGIVVLGLGLFAFSLNAKNPFRQESRTACK
jgi:hypothetical protein